MTQDQDRSTDDPTGQEDTIRQLRQALGTLESGEATVDEALQQLGVEVDEPVGELTRIPEPTPDRAASVAPVEDVGPGARESVPAHTGAPGADAVDAGVTGDGTAGGTVAPGAAEPSRGSRGPVRRTRSGWAVRQTVEPEEGLSDRELEQQARDIVLRRLEASDRTRAELAEALTERQIPSRIAGAVLDRMTEVGLIDDEAFARGWVASRQQRKHLSRRMLIEELRRKGIDPDLAQDVVQPVDEDDEYEAAAALVRKRLPGVERLEPSVQRRRLAGLLARRGFNSGLVFRVLDDVLGDHR